MWIVCLADDSHETSRPIFQENKIKNIYLKVSSAEIVIGALRVKLVWSYMYTYHWTGANKANNKIIIIF